MKKTLLTALLAVLMIIAVFAFSACDDGLLADGAKASITLNGDSIQLSDSSAGQVEGSDLKITKGGVYTVTGTLNDGQILIEVGKEINVTLILKNANLTCLDSAPIFVKSAKNCYIELADGTTNTVTDGETYAYANALETEPSAAIFSKADLFIQGTGALVVNANYNNAIASKDDLEIKGGNLTITAANNGLKGKDSVVIKKGDITITSSGDAIKSDEDANRAKGYVQIEGGTLNLTAGDEGIQAFTDVTINGGNITINAASNGIKSEYTIAINGGNVNITCGGDGADSPEISGAATVNGSQVQF